MRPRLDTEKPLEAALAPPGLSPRAQRRRARARAALYACCARCPMVSDHSDGAAWPVSELGGEWRALIPRKDGELRDLFACALSSDYARGYCRGLGREVDGYTVEAFLRWLEGEPSPTPVNDEQLSLFAPGTDPESDPPPRHP